MLAAVSAAWRVGADAARAALEPARPAGGFYVGLLAAVALAVAGGVRAARRPVAHRSRPDEPRLSRDGLGAGALDGGSRRVGLIMQLYCVARRLAGRMTARHDIDITNVALYWHFVAFTVVITVAVIAGFPAGGMRKAP